MNERPLTILLTDPHLSGGGQVRYVANLAREFTRLGHRVIIGCKPSSVLETRAQEAGCLLANRFPFRGGLRFQAWRADLNEVRRLIREFAPDILHASGSQDHWACAIENRRLGRPACMVRTRHNTYPVHNGYTNRVLNRRWTDYQIVVCETVRRALAQQPTFIAERMCTIHNGVDTQLYQPDPLARQALRAEFGYADDAIVCGMAARLVVDKGHRFLFEAAARLKSEVPVLRLLLLGQGKHEADLKRQVHALGLEAITTFAGYRTDTTRVMQAFDIGLVPSIACEASSFSLMEQMACERPMIVSDHGGSKEIVRDGIDGCVVPAGDSAALEQALRRLIREPGLRAEMGQRARARIRAEFTIEILAQRTLDACRTALAFHRHP